MTDKYQEGAEDRPTGYTPEIIVPDGYYAEKYGNGKWRIVKAIRAIELESLK